jgi:hypothetical protein
MENPLDQVDQLSLPLRIGCLGLMVSVVEYMLPASIARLRSYCTPYSSGISCRITVRSQKRALFDTELAVDGCLRRIERRINVDGEEVTVSYANEGDEGS